MKSTPRVLIVEDEAAIAELISINLKHNGFAPVWASDAEGAGEMFRVSTLPADNPPKNEDGSTNFKEDFFKEQPQAHLVQQK